jgi:membrane protease YdiL (CAAX protease family)
MGWFQQVGGILAVLLFALLLQDSSTILGLGVPRSPWLVRSVLVGLSITVLGGFAGLAVGDPVHRHGIEYFAYEATMPGIGEELGFRGVLLGCLIAGLARRDAPSARRWLVIVVAAIPFAALHLLERSGWQLAIMSGFTLYAGAALGWARLSTGSLLTAVLAHNVANVASGVIDNFLA